MILGSGLIQSANTFVGAYDAIPSIAAAYSTRRLLSSYEGPLLRLVADRAGYPEQDIGYTAAGDLDTATAASFLSGDAGYVTKWYDQSGNTRDAAQATLANMPLYVASGQNSRPILRFDGTNDRMAAARATGAAITVLCAVQQRSSQVNKRVFSLGATDYSDIYTVVTTYAFGYYSTQASGAYAIGGNASTFSLITLLISSASVADVYVNGTISGGGGFAPSDGYTSNATLTIATSGNGNNSGAMDIPELVLCNAALSAPNRSAAETAANAYWSIY